MSSSPTRPAHSSLSPSNREEQEHQNHISTSSITEDSESLIHTPPPPPSKPSLGKRNRSPGTYSTHTLDSIVEEGEEISPSDERFPKYHRGTTPPPAPISQESNQINSFSHITIPIYEGKKDSSGAPIDPAAKLTMKLFSALAIVNRNLELIFNNQVKQPFVNPELVNHITYLTNSAASIIETVQTITTNVDTININQDNGNSTLNRIEATTDFISSNIDEVSRSNSQKEREAEEISNVYISNAETLRAYNSFTYRDALGEIPNYRGGRGGASNSGGTRGGSGGRGRRRGHGGAGDRNNGVARANEDPMDEGPREEPPAASPAQINADFFSHEAPPPSGAPSEGKKFNVLSYHVYNPNIAELNPKSRMNAILGWEETLGIKKKVAMSSYYDHTLELIVPEENVEVIKKTLSKFKQVSGDLRFCYHGMKVCELQTNLRNTATHHISNRIGRLLSKTNKIPIRDAILKGLDDEDIKEACLLHESNIRTKNQGQGVFLRRNL